MEKVLLRFRFSEPIRIEGKDFDQFSPYLIDYLKSHLKGAELLCADSFKKIDEQPGFEDLDAEGGAFSFMEIICELDKKYSEDCATHKDEIVSYLLQILDEESISLTDVHYHNDDKYITVTNKRLLPL